MSLIKLNTRNSAVSPFDALFNDFFEGEFFPSTRNNARLGSVPAANIKESEKYFLVEIAAPGMKKEDFKLELNEELLSIRAERKEQHEESKERYTKREFNYTSFVRSFRLPEGVDVEKIAAAYNDGILSIEIPKMEIEQKQKVREISIK